MKAKAGVQICLAVALFGYAPVLHGGYLIALLLVASFLTLSSVILFSNKAFSYHWWDRLVHVLSVVEVRYSAIGFGFVVAGASLINPSWYPLGIIFILVGAFIIGAGLGIQLRRLSFACCPITLKICPLRLLKPRGKMSICDRCLCRFLCLTSSDKHPKS